LSSYNKTIFKAALLSLLQLKIMAGSGLLIEDLDIADLQQALNEDDDNEDIKFVYGNLLRASYNHMKAFYFHASRRGQVYNPVYISESQYQEITGSEKL